MKAPKEKREIRKRLSKRRRICQKMSAWIMWSKCIITLWVAVSIYHVNNIHINRCMYSTCSVYMCNACIVSCLCVRERVSGRNSNGFARVRRAQMPNQDKKIWTARMLLHAPCSMLQTPNEKICAKKFFISRHHYFSLEEWLLNVVFFSSLVSHSLRVRFFFFVCIIFDLVCGACGIIEHPLNWFQLFAI